MRSSRRTRVTPRAARVSVRRPADPDRFGIELYPPRPATNATPGARAMFLSLPVSICPGLRWPMLSTHGCGGSETDVFIRLHCEPLLITDVAAHTCVSPILSASVLQWPAGTRNDHGPNLLTSGKDYPDARRRRTDRASAGRCFGGQYRRAGGFTLLRCLPCG
jgi:hypothetical protein